MGCWGVIASPESAAVLLRRTARRRPSCSAASVVACLAAGGDSLAAPARARSAAAGDRTVEFRTLGGCKLGISRFPEFDYDAIGGAGNAVAVAEDGELSVEFEAESLYIPPLTSATTRFLGLPLPPFLKIEIVPERLQGVLNAQTGQVDLDFRAKFWFSVGSLYRAPALKVETMLTSEESKGIIKAGRGRRLDPSGLCTLVGVATVAPVGDLLLDSFLSLPTECIARLNARISISPLSQ